MRLVVHEAQIFVAHREQAIVETAEIVPGAEARWRAHDDAVSLVMRRGDHDRAWPRDLGGERLDEGARGRIAQHQIGCAVGQEEARLDHVLQMMRFRPPRQPRAVLEHMTRELIEVEVMDAEQLHKILDSHKTSPQIKPGTFLDRPVEDVVPPAAPAADPRSAVEGA